MLRLPTVLLGFIVLLAASPAISQDSADRPVVTIAKGGWAAEYGSEGAYVAGQRIAVKVTVTGGSSPSSIHLKDHDSYHGTLDYPTSIVIRVTDARGQSLTSNDISDDDWWSFYYLWSTLFEDMPGDVIELAPGDELIRIVPIDQVLAGCPGVGGGLQPGRYVVQLRVDGILSNELEIEVRAESATG